MDAGTGISPFPRCYTSCIGPQESREFTVKPARYGISARAQDRASDPQQGTAFEGDFEVQTSAHVVLGVAPYRHASAGGPEYGIGKARDVYVPPEAPAGPCTPTGARYTGNPCCSGIYIFDDKRSLSVCSDPR